MYAVLLARLIYLCKIDFWNVPMCHSVIVVDPYNMTGVSFTGEIRGEN